MQPGNLGIIQDWWDSFPFLPVTTPKLYSVPLQWPLLSPAETFRLDAISSPIFPHLPVSLHISYLIIILLSRPSSVSILRTPFPSLKVFTVPMSNVSRPLFWLQLTTTGCTKTTDEHWLTETGERALSKWTLCGKRQGNSTVLSLLWKWEGVVVWPSDKGNTKLRTINAKKKDWSIPRS